MPTVLRHAEANSDITSAQYKLLSKVTANPPKVRTIGKWMTLLGLNYDKYFSRTGNKEMSKNIKAGLEKYYSNPEKRLEQSLKLKEYYRRNPRGGKCKTPVSEGDEASGAGVGLGTAEELSYASPDSSSDMDETHITRTVDVDEPKEGVEDAGN